MRVDSSPFQRLSERMRAALYPGAPEAMLPIGKESDIRVMTTAAALELYGAAYGPNNAVLVVAGDVTEDAVRTLAEKHYGKLKPLASLPARTPTIKPAPITEVRHQERDPQVTFPGVALYYRVPGMAHADAPALTVLFNALNHLTGALRRELIEKKAIATAVSASFGPQLTHGVFSIAADAAPGVTAEALESALEAVIEEVRRVGVTEERVKSFTDAINASTVFDRDDIIARMDDYGYKVAAGMPIEWIDQSEARFNAVTAADVKRVAETYLAPSNRVVGWLLPAEATAPTASAQP
jgi:zinc protease